MPGAMQGECNQRGAWPVAVHPCSRQAPADLQGVKGAPSGLQVERSGMKGAARADLHRQVHQPTLDEHHTVQDVLLLQDDLACAQANAQQQKHTQGAKERGGHRRGGRPRSGSGPTCTGKGRRKTRPAKQLLRNQPTSACTRRRLRHTHPAGPRCAAPTGPPPPAAWGTGQTGAPATAADRTTGAPPAAWGGKGMGWHGRVGGQARAGGRTTCASDQPACHGMGCYKTERRCPASNPRRGLACARMAGGSSCSTLSSCSTRRLLYLQQAIGRVGGGGKQPCPQASFPIPIAGGWDSSARCPRSSVPSLPALWQALPATDSQTRKAG